MQSMQPAQIANTLTTRQVAERLQIRLGRVRRLIKAGYIPAMKVGWTYLVPIESLPDVADLPTGLGPPKGSKNRKKRTDLYPHGPRGVEGELLCVICMSHGKMTPAVRQSRNYNVAGLNMCLSHAEEYDNLL